MTGQPDPKRPFAPQRAGLAWLFLCVSGLLHLGLGWLGGGLSQLPDLDVQLAVPIEVELGMTEAATVDPVASAPEPAAPPTESIPETTPGEGRPEDQDNEPPEPEPARDAGAETENGEPDDAGSPRPDAGIRLAAGTQISLRVDMQRIRRSPLAEDIRGLVAVIPDWQALLAGSGIDAVEQLDRLLIASPDLSREKSVIAGRYVGGEKVVTDAVQRLAEAAGENAPFKTRDGVRVAPWKNRDSTPRVIALLGPGHFAISRAEDLKKVLGIAQVRAARKRDPADAGPSPAEALLSMPDRAGLSLEVEGVAQFVRRAGMDVPARASAAVIEETEQNIGITASLWFDDAQTALRARGFWTEKRDLYARNPLVLLLGLDGPLRAAKLSAEGDELRLRTSVTVAQARLLLGYLRELVAPPSRGPH